METRGGFRSPEEQQAAQRFEVEDREEEPGGNVEIGGKSRFAVDSIRRETYPEDSPGRKLERIDLNDQIKEELRELPSLELYTRDGEKVKLSMDLFGASEVLNLYPDRAVTEIRVIETDKIQEARASIDENGKFNSFNVRLRGRGEGSREPLQIAGNNITAVSIYRGPESRLT